MNSIQYLHRIKVNGNENPCSFQNFSFDQKKTFPGCCHEFIFYPDESEEKFSGAVQKIAEMIACPGIYQFFLMFKGEHIKPDDFMAVLLQLYEQMSNDDDYQDLIGKVILRIIISIKKMTGRQFGAYGYLNILKNNIHPSSLKGTKGPIIEYKDGRMMQYDE